MKIDYLRVPANRYYSKLEKLEDGITLGVPRVIEINKNNVFVNYSEYKNIITQLSTYIDHDAPPIEENDKLLFMKSVNFPRRKLENISLYSKIKNLKPVRKSENATKIIGNKSEFKDLIKAIESNIDNRVKQSMVSPGYYSRRLLVKTTNGTFLSPSISPRVKLNNPIITKEEFETHPLNIELQSNVQLTLTNEHTFVEGELFVELCDTLSGFEQWIEAYNNNWIVTDISELYKVIGTTVIDFQEFERLSNLIGRSVGNNVNVLKMVAENLPSYDVDKSMFYLSLLFKNHFQRNQSFMNTNVKSLYDFCNSACGFNRSIPQMIKELGAKGYQMNIPFSFFVNNSGIKYNVSSTLRQAQDVGLNAEIKVSISEELMEHLYMDVDLDEFNKNLNK